MTKLATAVSWIKLKEWRFKKLWVSVALFVLGNVVVIVIILPGWERKGTSKEA